VKLLSAVTDTPRLESELLLANIMQCTRVFLLAHPEIPLSEEQIQQYKVDIGRRANYEPLPYITGKMEFYGLLFDVTFNVLIPRPETEQLVDLAVEWLAYHQDAVVLDVGTGSGCIAVAIASQAKCRYICCTDISFIALQVAQQNAARHQVLNRVGFINCDLLSSIRNPVDVIVSNPPYIAACEYSNLPPSVRYEPYKALVAGVDGLQIIKRLLDQATGILNPNGYMLMEIGAQQGKTVLSIARTFFPNASIQILKDLAGLDRILCIECN
jgi:release factor glutamine methyltransferase